MPPTRHAILEELATVLRCRRTHIPDLTVSATAHLFLTVLGETAGGSISVALLSSRIRPLIAPAVRVDLVSHFPLLCRELCSCRIVTQTDVVEVLRSCGIHSDAASLPLAASSSCEPLALVAGENEART